MKACASFAALLLALACSAPLFAEVNLQHRWVYCGQNLLVDKNVDQLIGIMEEAKKAGYSGILLTDYKFNILDRMDERYFRNARRVIDKAKELGLELVPAVFPIGYAGGVLAHDPNLAEGLPVAGAPFEVKDGRLVPLMDEKTRLVNGDFEDSPGGKFSGWWQENVGESVFADRDVVKEGKTSLRMENIAKASAQHGHCRLHQLVKTEPFRYYHLSVWIRTENFEAPQSIKVQGLAKKPGALIYADFPVKKTQDWTQYHVTFNSLTNTEVRIYIGTWGGKSGKLWWDGLTLEPGGFVNVIRRDAAPLKLTTANALGEHAPLVEGKDFDRVADPKLCNDPYLGAATVWHAEPEVKVPDGSRLKDGDRVLASYYHTVIVGHSQLACDLLDPKLFEILDDQMKRVHELFGAKAYMMSHDEIRVAGWTTDYAGLTCGQALAVNVKKCCEIVRKHAPGATVYVWSDMFDPNHNAIDNYYLVKTTWAGSWEGLPRDVVMVDWYAGKAAETFKFFHARGHKQFIAGYYDGDPDANAKQWLTAAKASPANIIGVMYTTWQSKFGDLARFMDAVRKYEK